jgi:hypothetical protein
MSTVRVFHLNDEGHKYSDDYAVNRNHVVDAVRGTLACPEQAISLVDETGTALSEAGLAVEGVVEVHRARRATDGRGPVQARQSTA